MYRPTGFSQVHVGHRDRDQCSSHSLNEDAQASVHKEHLEHRRNKDDKWGQEHTQGHAPTRWTCPSCVGELPRQSTSPGHILIEGQCRFHGTSGRQTSERTGRRSRDPRRPTGQDATQQLRLGIAAAEAPVGLQPLGAIDAKGEEEGSEEAPFADDDDDDEAPVIEEEDSPVSPSIPIVAPPPEEGVEYGHQEEHAPPPPPPPRAEEREDVEEKAI